VVLDSTAPSSTAASDPEVDNRRLWSGLWEEGVERLREETLGVYDRREWSLR